MGHEMLPTTGRGRGTLTGEGVVSRGEEQEEVLVGYLPQLNVF